MTFAVGAHLFNPTSWPPLGDDILHSLHGPGFALTAAILYLYFRSRGRSFTNYILAGGVAMGIGLLSEIAQIPGPRDAQVKDLFVDGLGIFGALGTIAMFDKSLRLVMPRLLRTILPAAAVIALLAACLPTIWFSYSLVQQRAAFPMLLSFEERWEGTSYNQFNGMRPTIIDAPNGWTAGGHIAHSTESGKWGSFLTLHPLPDWSKYSRVVFDAASADDNFALYVCLRDGKPSTETGTIRFCKSFELTTEPRTFSIEFDDVRAAESVRTLELTNVGALIFSAAKPGGANELFLDSVRLE